MRGNFQLPFPSSDNSQISTLEKSPERSSESLLMTGQVLFEQRVLSIKPKKLDFSTKESPQPNKRIALINFTKKTETGLKRKAHVECPAYGKVLFGKRKRESEDLFENSASKKISKETPKANSLSRFEQDFENVKVVILIKRRSFTPMKRQQFTQLHIVLISLSIL